MVRTDTFLRRCVDLALAAAGLVILLPLLLFLAVGVKMSSPGPAIYRQRRVGRGERPFEILKLRTMAVGTDRTGSLVSGSADPRATRFGQWLRTNRLDEIPQLVNVLRGELTIFGPRPEVERYVSYYTAAERLLLQVRPGLLGAGALLFVGTQADVLNGATDQEAHYLESQLHPKLRLDLEYLITRSIRRDLVLLWQTVRLLLHHGHSDVPQAPRPRSGVQST
jgi:lipopolysaccharide/colanic/teichoic acid biosynthesis glycosyltransferase